MRYLCLPLLAGMILLVACGQGPPEGNPVIFDENSAAEQTPGLHLEAPQGWLPEQPSSRMRVAQYRLPGAGDAEPAELAVFTFPGTGGSVQANLDRWIGQFAEADRETATITAEQINQLPVTLLDIRGTFTPGAMVAGDQPTARPNYRVLAAVIETPQDPWFIKLTGPAQTVERWEEGFRQYIESARLESHPE